MRHQFVVLVVVASIHVMPLSIVVVMAPQVTWTPRMGASARALMATLAQIAPPVQCATLPSIAVVMAPQMIWTALTGVTALAWKPTLAQVVQQLHTHTTRRQQVSSVPRQK